MRHPVLLSAGKLRRREDGELKIIQGPQESWGRVSSHWDDRAVSGASGKRGSTPFVYSPIQATWLPRGWGYTASATSSWPDTSFPITPIFSLSQVVMGDAKLHKSELSTCINGNNGS